VRLLPAVPNGPRTTNDVVEPGTHKPTGAFSGPSARVPNLAAAPMPGTIRNFAGLSYADTCTGGQCGTGYPPDINGDVGPNHYIEAVNEAFAIYAKTGTLLASFTENSLFAALGATPCNGDSAGDPVVIYDQLADRWILTNLAFAFDGGGNPIAPFYECIAVSKTGDPVAGGWNLYALQMDAGVPAAGMLNDYPKFGTWIDCLYMTSNEYSFPGGTYAGTAFASLSLKDLESGAPLTWSVGTLDTSGPFTMIPSNLSGAPAAQRPAPGTPDYLVSESTSAFDFEVRKFTTSANCGAGTLGSPTLVSQAGYTPPGDFIVPQPNVSTVLDSLGDRLMQKVQYRKVGGAESLWVTHSVGLTGPTGLAPQWAQLDVTGGTVATTPVQEQIYAPDNTLWRWMGSIAADTQGNVALGYSTSNGTSPNFPSIAYSGRLAGDPLNSLPRTEVQVIAGGGSQNNGCGPYPQCPRWGDYTSMSVDPSDDCTFWYTNEYYDSQTSGDAGNWHTRIASFKFPSCVVVQAPSIAKAFGAATVPVNGTTSLTFTITNPNTSLGLTGVAFTDTLPAGLKVALFNGLTNGCGGTATATGGSTFISLSGGAIAAGGTCQLGLNVTSVAAGQATNTTGAISSTEGGTGNTATARIAIVAPPTVTKRFGASQILVGGTTSLTLVLANPASNPVTLTGVGVSDTLPAGLAFTTAGLSCTGGVGPGGITLNGSTFALTNGVYPPGGSCTFAATVKSTTPGLKHNVTTAPTSNEGGSGTPAAADLRVLGPPTLAKSFSPAAIPPGGSSTLTFTIGNPAGNPFPLTGIGFTDTLPSGLVVATPNGLLDTCGATITAAAGSSTITVAGVALAAGSSCTISLGVTTTATAPGDYTNTTSAPTSAEGGSGTPATADLAVVVPPTIAKSFGDASIPVGASTSLSFTVTNPAANPVSLSGIGFTDSLPAGLVVATPDGLTGSCGGGTISATGGSGTVSLSGASLAPGASCTFSVDVTGTSPGVQDNAVTVTSLEGGDGNTASASLTVVAPPVIAKRFGAASIPPGGSTGLTFTLANPAANPVTLTGIAFTDTLPAGLVVATPNGLSATCGGTLTALAGSSAIDLSGASLAPGASCTVIVNVTGTTVGTKTNAVQATSLEGGTSTIATASISVLTPPDLVIAKHHEGDFTVGQINATWRITVSNAGGAPTTGPVTVTDQLPDDGLLLDLISGSGWSCDNATVTCTRSDPLAGGASYPDILVEVIVPNVIPSPVVNVATVSGGGETNTANDTASDPTTILPHE
jgi:uncharacterized repeat protein (TIGR01451 family)